MESKEKVVVKIISDTSELDEVCAKVERLTSCLQEAMELAQSIASLDLDLRINTVIDGKSTELARVTAESGSPFYRLGCWHTL